MLNSFWCPGSSHFDLCFPCISALTTWSIPVPLSSERAKKEQSNFFPHPSLNPTILGLTLAVSETSTPATSERIPVIPRILRASANVETTQRKQRRAMQEIWGGGELGRKRAKKIQKYIIKYIMPPPHFLFPPFSLAQLSYCHLMSKHLCCKTYWDLTAKCCLRHGKKHGSWMDHMGESCKMNVVLWLTAEKPTFLWKHLSNKLHLNLSSFKYAHSNKKCYNVLAFLFQ